MINSSSKSELPTLCDMFGSKCDAWPIVSNLWQFAQN